MKIPVCKKLGKVTGFWNNYSALTILALVFSAFTVHAQLLDTVGKRTTQGGSGFIFIQPQEFLKGLIPPRDTLRLAIKDTGAIAYKNGAFYQWSKKSGVLRWDSLQAKGGAGGSGTDSAANPGAFTKKTIIGTVRVFDVDTARFRRVDTTYMLNDSIRRTVINGKNYDQLQKGSPFKQFYDPTQFDTTGGVLHCINCGVGGTPGPIYWYANTDSLKAYKPADGSVGYTNEYSLGNRGGLRYVFIAASTATGNNMTILTPTAGGTGRWFAQPANGKLTFRQLGVFPSSDNTTAMNAAEVAAKAAGYHFIGVDENSNYKIDPATGFIPVDSMTLYGVDTITSQLTPKTYATHGKFLIIYNSVSDTLIDFHVVNLRLDYLQKGNFSGGFASGNPIGDTDSHIINITLGRNIYIEGNAIVNGGTQSAVNLVHVINGFVRRNRFDSIGCKVLSTVGVADNYNIHFEFNSVRRSGWYERWSTETELPQEGDDVAYLGGTLNYLNDNEVSEMYGRWFWSEGTIFGYNECKRNKIHGSNKNHLGLSWGNNPATTVWATGVQITDNVYDGITFDHFTSADSATVRSVFQPKRFATCLFEFGGMENLYQHDYLSHPHFTVARHMRNSWFDNIINSPNSNTNTDPSGGQIIYQIGTGSGDSVLNTKITGPINFKDGQIFKTYPGGCVVKDLNISVNAKWTGTGFIGEIYPATGAVVPTGININGSTFAGNVGSAFYTGTATPIVMNFTNNVASNIDTSTNFLTVASGVAPTINKENTRFSTGVFTTHVLKVNNTIPDAAGNVTVSGGFAPLGTIYNKNSWTNLADFTQAGGITASIVSNKIQVSGGAGTYTQLLELTPALGYTKLEHYKVAMKVKQGAINSTSYGYGIGVNSKNTFVNAGVVARIGFTSGSNPAGIELDANGGASYTAVSYTRRQISASANDYILVTAEKNGYDIHYTARNLTTNSALIDSTFAVGENTGPFSIFSMGGTFTIDSLAITSTELTGGSLFIGDSKTEGAGASDIDHRFLAYLQSKYDGVVGVGGGGDRTVEILGRIQQILSLRPRRAFLEIGSNDLRSGVSDATFKANFQAISDSLIAHGVDVYYLLPFYETSEDLSGQRAWIISTFPAAKVVDTWAPMAVPGRLAVDGIHPNDAGHQAIADAIVQANIIKEAKTELRVAASTGGYTLPAATTSVLGGVKVDGTTVIMTGDVLSAPGGGAGNLQGVTDAGNSTSNLIRSTGVGNIPGSGTGMEVYYDGTYGNIGAYNRSGGVAVDMVFQSKTGVLTIPDSSLTTVTGIHSKGGLRVDNLAKSAAKYLLHWDPTSHIVSYADSSNGGGGSDLQAVTDVGNNTTNLLRITGVNNVPASGVGLELFWDGTYGNIGAFNRSTSTAQPMVLQSVTGVQVVPDSSLTAIGMHATGGVKIDKPARAAGKYIVHWDESTHNLSIADSSAGGGSGTSGTYTPTLTSGTNIASSTSNIAHYIRVGNEVTVTGNILITPTAGSNTQTVIDISLPVASNLAANTDCQGLGIAYAVSAALNEVGQFTANSTNHRATYTFYATSTTAFTLNYHFTYTVL